MNVLLAACSTLHCPNVGSLSILGILGSEGAGTVPAPDFEAQMKEWQERLLGDCSSPTPWRTHKLQSQHILESH